MHALERHVPDHLAHRVRTNYAVQELDVLLQGGLPVGHVRPASAHRPCDHVRVDLVARAVADDDVYLLAMLGSVGHDALEFHDLEQRPIEKVGRLTVEIVGIGWPEVAERIHPQT